MCKDVNILILPVAESRNNAVSTRFHMAECNRILHVV